MLLDQLAGMLELAWVRSGEHQQQSVYKHLAPLATLWPSHEFRGILIDTHFACLSSCCQVEHTNTITYATPCSLSINWFSPVMSCRPCIAAAVGDLGQTMP